MLPMMKYESKQDKLIEIHMNLKGRVLTVCTNETLQGISWIDWGGISFHRLTNHNSWHIRYKLMYLFDKVRRCATTVHYDFKNFSLNFHGLYIGIDLYEFRPILDIHKKVVGILGCFYHRCLAESNHCLETPRKYLQLYQKMRDASVFFQLIYGDNKNICDLCLLESNDEFQRKFNLSRDQTYGKLVSEIYPEILQYIITYYQNNKMDLHNGRIHMQDCYFPFYNRWYDLIFYTVEEEGWVAIFEDITEHKHFQEKLYEANHHADIANEAKSKFMSRISHELRTPVSAITGLIDLTLDSSLDEMQKNKLLSVKEVASELRVMIDELLEYESLATKKISIESIEFSFECLIVDLICTFSHQCAKKLITFAAHCSKNIPPYLIGDEKRIRNVLVHLLQNAIKFTESGVVSFYVKVVSETIDQVELLFGIMDTGIGIDIENQESVFDEFSQVDNSYRRKYGGMGLGLCISQQIAKMMGSTIGVTSTKEMGSNFQFVLELKKGSKKNYFHKAINMQPMKIKIGYYGEENFIDGHIAQYLISFGHQLEYLGDLLSYSETNGNQYDIIILKLSDDMWSMMENITWDRRKRAIPILCIKEKELVSNLEYSLWHQFNGIVSESTHYSIIHHMIMGLCASVIDKMGIIDRISKDIISEEYHNRVSSHYNANQVNQAKISEFEIDLDIMESALAQKNYDIISLMLKDVLSLSEELGLLDAWEIVTFLIEKFDGSNLDVIEYGLRQLKNIILKFKYCVW